MQKVCKSCATLNNHKLLLLNNVQALKPGYYFVCKILTILNVVHTKDNDNADMEFVKKFTPPDFQAKNFTPQKRVNCDIFLANQQRKCIKY